MAEFLVLYEEPKLLVDRDRSWYEFEGHSLVVDAEDEAWAFVAAYDYLTRRGHMVRTMKAGTTLDDIMRLQEERRRYDPSVQIAVVAGLSLEQMQVGYDAGIPVIGGRLDNQRMTNIIRIQPYAIQHTPAVVIQDDA